MIIGLCLGVLMAIIWTVHFSTYECKNFSDYVAMVFFFGIVGSFILGLVGAIVWSLLEKVCADWTIVAFFVCFLLPQFIAIIRDPKLPGTCRDTGNQYLINTKNGKVTSIQRMGKN